MMTCVKVARWKWFMMKNHNDFLNELVRLHPTLQPFYASEHYQNSLKIIERMQTKDLTEAQLAKRLNVTMDYVSRLTSGDDSIQVSEYRQVLQFLQ